MRRRRTGATGIAPGGWPAPKSGDEPLGKPICGGRHAANTGREQIEPLAASFAESRAAAREAKTRRKTASSQDFPKEAFERNTAAIGNAKLSGQKPIETDCVEILLGQQTYPVVIHIHCPTSAPSRARQKKRPGLLRTARGMDPKDLPQNL
jgi:hypothetical protein